MIALAFANIRNLYCDNDITLSHSSASQTKFIDSLKQSELISNIV
jgi:hypothetical protein